ncbi:MAG: hypothetical protein ABL986_04565 [Vicinamibacterales bacterium]
MMQTGQSDTDPETASVHLEMLRRSSPGRRLALTFSLSRSVMALSRDALARQSPGASTEDVGLRFIAESYGVDLAEGVRAALAARRL